MAARNIILLSDGTGNSSGKLFKTNVWRVYQALNLTSANQIAYYDNGVGTSSFKPLALLGGAFGFGLKRNILGLYMFLCRNYRPGDCIHGFGFSRGAFTIRVLVNFVLSMGLVSDFDSTDDLKRKSRALYRQFRKKQSKLFRLSEAVRWLVYLFLRPVEPKNIKTQAVARIRFLGLWDTVDAYGLPVEELKTGIDKFIWPLALEDRKLDPKVDKACHALSIDDKRTSFHPLLWDEAEEATASVHTDEERLTQVWFAGAHANVGGGYPDDGLSYVSLRWMIHEVRRRNELVLKPRAVEDIEVAAAPFGKFYNSRAGLGAYYRYEPRWLSPPTDKQHACIPHPKIHESVIWRMAAGTDSYAPLSLPTTLRIVADAPPQESRCTAAPARRDRAGNVFEFSDYQTMIRAEARGPAAAEARDAMPAANVTGVPDVSTLEKPDDATLDLVWATVWWRRIAYFATLATTLLIVAWPWLRELHFQAPEEVRRQKVVWEFLFPTTVEPTAAWNIFSAVGDVLRPAIGIAIDLAGSLLPEFAKSSLTPHKSAPWSLVCLCLLLVATIAWGAWLDRRIHDRALAAWNTKWREQRAGWLKTAAKYRAVFGAAIVATAVLVGQPFAKLYSAVKDLGSRPIIGEPSVIDLVLIGVYHRIQTSSLIAIALIALLGLAGGAYGAWMARLALGATDRQRELPSPALTLANWIRTARPLKLLYQGVAHVVLPVGFALILVVTALIGLNRFSFAVISMGGWACHTSGPSEPLKAVGESRQFTFKLTDGCFASPISLAQGATYEIKVDNTETNSPAADGRFDTLPGLKYWALPIRRMLDQPWFIPIARVGDVAGEEFPLVQTVTRITPRQDGTLFVFVNDAVLGVPKWWGVFYRWDGGTGTVTVKTVAQAPQT